MGLSAKRDRLAVEYRKNKYGEVGGPFYEHEMDETFLAGYVSRDAAFKELVGALKKSSSAFETFLKLSERTGDVLRVNEPAFRYAVQSWNDAREALAKYGKGGT